MVKAVADRLKNVLGRAIFSSYKAFFEGRILNAVIIANKAIESG